MDSLQGGWVRRSPRGTALAHHHLQRLLMTTAPRPSPMTMPAGSHALCSCGLSRNGAFCDGSHQGSGKSPQILTLEEEQTVFLCSCGTSARKPFCDGSHLQRSAATAQAVRPWWKFWA